jgi:SulP family sulfate permease
MRRPTLAALPLLAQLREHDREAVRGDVIAGSSTAVLLIPQAMAYAMLAGLDPVVGLYASTAPLFVYALLGTSRQLSVGPVAMDSLLVAAAVAAIAAGEPVRYAALATALALMVGAVQFGMGTARLGFLARFLSQSVLSGFTSGAALLIAAAQLRHLLGISLPGSSRLHEALWQASQRLDETHLPTLALAASSLLFLLAAQRWAPRLPRFLAVIVLATSVSWWFGLGERGVRVVGAVPAALPSLGLPSVATSDLLALLPAAFTIAFVSFLESVSVGAKLARLHHYPLDPNRELIALGAANFAGGLVHGYPVAGGLSRSAVNDQAGARSGLASLVTAGFVLLTLRFLTPLFYHLPNAVLAAILVAAVSSLVDLHEARRLWAISRADASLLAVTFLGTIVVGIQEGVLFGAFASVLWFAWRASEPHIAVLGQLPGTTIYRNLKRHPDAVPHPHLVALRPDAPFFFANTEHVAHAVHSAIEHEDIRHVVLDFSGIGTVDAQALSTLDELLSDLRGRQIQLWLSSVRGPVRDRFAASGFDQRLGHEHLVERVHDAVLAADPPPDNVVPLQRSL